MCSALPTAGPAALGCGPPASCERPPRKGNTGDLVLCHPVIVREAREQGKSVRAHYAHLVMHGMLHLRGYAHGRRMEAREIRLLRRFGFRNPYTVESPGT